VPRVRTSSRWGSSSAKRHDVAEACCAMKRKFITGIVATVMSEPMPIDVVDYVVRWAQPGEPGEMIMPYCCWCGKKQKYVKRDPNPPIKGG